MNLYLISQTQNQTYGTYDSAVVAAESENHARAIHPIGSDEVRANMEKDCWEYYESESAKTRKCIRIGYFSDCWAKRPSEVNVLLIGTAVDSTSAGVICANFS